MSLAKQSQIEEQLWSLVHQIDYADHKSVEKGRNILKDFVNGEMNFIARLRGIYQAKVAECKKAHDRDMSTRRLKSTMTEDELDDYTNLVISLGKDCYNEVVENPTGTTAMVIMKLAEQNSYFKSFGYIFLPAADEDGHLFKGKEDDRMVVLEKRANVVGLVGANEQKVEEDENASEGGSDEGEHHDGDGFNLSQIHRLAEKMHHYCWELMKAVSDAIAVEKDEDIIFRLTSLRVHLDETYDWVEAIKATCNEIKGLRL
ncbi:hypothetical protein HK097_007342 [Rhizophlyctis rosea]|uniref:Uncharacterized protein n=1 Tax=Rhizophlyctis rosea TaxID=64517 RepID=A0AAD5X5Y8_9FUNG|nr:hypothetical protein HK097_007342 [Rhizophlyctis rosea]